MHSAAGEGFNGERTRCLIHSQERRETLRGDETGTEKGRESLFLESHAVDCHIDVFIVARSVTHTYPFKTAR